MQKLHLRLTLAITAGVLAMSHSGSAPSRLDSYKEVKREGPTATQLIEVTGPADFSDLIEVVRPLKDHPPVSPAMVKAVRYALKRLPDSILRLLRSNGTRIYLTTTLLDKEPGLKNKEGRGYDGYTLRSCPGMFRNHSIYVCERTLDEFDESPKEAISTPEIVNIFYHECGHAISFYHGELSRTGEFKHAYLLDSARIEPDLKADLAYYLQKGETGQEECCAELLAIMLGKTADKSVRMIAAFPMTCTFLRQKTGIE